MANAAEVNVKPVIIVVGSAVAETSRKRHSSCGGDDPDPVPIPVQHISPSVPDASQVHGSCSQTAVRLNQLSELTIRVSCPSPSQPPELAAAARCPTQQSESRLTSPGQRSEFAV